MSAGLQSRTRQSFESVENRRPRTLPDRNIDSWVSLIPISSATALAVTPRRVSTASSVTRIGISNEFLKGGLEPRRFGFERLRPLHHVRKHDEREPDDHQRQRRHVEQSERATQPLLFPECRQQRREQQRGRRTKHQSPPNTSQHFNHRRKAEVAPRQG